MTLPVSTGKLWFFRMKGAPTFYAGVECRFDKTIKDERRIMEKPQEITVNGVNYYPAPSSGTYKIVRTYSAGVFAGNVVRKEGREVGMVNARRLWYWKGAASLSQLAMEGVKNPSECKFAMPVSVTLTESTEILDVAESAQASITGVPVWKI